jgi:hypothetical protein
MYLVYFRKSYEFVTHEPIDLRISHQFLSSKTRPLFFSAEDVKTSRFEEAIIQFLDLEGQNHGLNFLTKNLPG